MITKDCKLQLKELDQKARIVEGYFSSFDNQDSDGDIIRKGAFKKSIAENGPSGTGRIKHLFNHWSTAGVLEKIYEDDFGLGFRSKIGNHTLGNDVLNMYLDGIITEHSIGFIIPEGKSTPIPEAGKDIKEVMLWEGSSLDKWGANMRTPVIKSIDQYEIFKKEWVKRYEILSKALRNRTNYTDDTYMDFVIQLEVMKSTFENVLEQLKPEASTLVKEPHVSVDYQKIFDNLKL